MILEGTLVRRKPEKKKPMAGWWGNLTKTEREGRVNTRPGVFTIHQAIREVMPYSLYPKDELIKLTKMIFWLMACAINDNKLVALPFIGRVWKHVPQRRTIWNSKKQLVEVMQAMTVKLKPNKFMKFIIDAPNVAKYDYAKCDFYLKQMEELRICFCQHDPNWLDKYIPEKRVLDYIKYKIAHSKAKHCQRPRPHMKITHNFFGM